MRWYDERIEVRSESSGPVAFIWRERLYAVREIFGCWREKDEWWLREGVRLREGFERQVWRVEAGRLAGAGVFDLAEAVPLDRSLSHELCPGRDADRVPASPVPVLTGIAVGAAGRDSLSPGRRGVSDPSATLPVPYPPPRPVTETDWRLLRAAD